MPCGRDARCGGPGRTATDGAGQRGTSSAVTAANVPARLMRELGIRLEEPVPTLADPFPENDPLPGAYELHLPSDGVTI